MPVNDDPAAPEEQPQPIERFDQLGSISATGAPPPTRRPRGWIVAVAPALIWLVASVPIFLSNAESVFTFEDLDVPGSTEVELEAGRRYTVMVTSDDNVVSQPERELFHARVRDPEGDRVELSTEAPWYQTTIPGIAYVGDFDADTSGTYRLRVTADESTSARASLQPDLNRRPQPEGHIQTAGSIAAMLSFVLLLRRWRRHRGAH